MVENRHREVERLGIVTMVTHGARREGSGGAFVSPSHLPRAPHCMRTSGAELLRGMVHGTAR